MRQDESNIFDDTIIQTIVSKLGYSPDEVKKYIKEENSFVGVLYNKILEEQTQKIQHTIARNTNNFSAKLGI